MSEKWKEYQDYDCQGKFTFATLKDKTEYELPSEALFQIQPLAPSRRIFYESLRRINTKKEHIFESYLYSNCTKIFNSEIKYSGRVESDAPQTVLEKTVSNPVDFLSELNKASTPMTPQPSPYHIQPPAQAHPANHKSPPIFNNHNSQPTPNSAEMTQILKEASPYQNPGTAQSFGSSPGTNYFSSGNFSTPLSHDASPSENSQVNKKLKSEEMKYELDAEDLDAWINYQPDNGFSTATSYIVKPSKNLIKQSDPSVSFSDEPLAVPQTQDSKRNRDRSKSSFVNTFRKYSIPPSYQPIQPAKSKSFSYSYTPKQELIRLSNDSDMSYSPTLFKPNTKNPTINSAMCDEEPMSGKETISPGEPICQTPQLRNEQHTHDNEPEPVESVTRTTRGNLQKRNKSDEIYCKPCVLYDYIFDSSASSVELISFLEGLLVTDPPISIGLPAFSDKSASLPNPNQITTPWIHHLDEFSSNYLTTEYLLKKRSALLSSQAPSAHFLFDNLSTSLGRLGIFFFQNLSEIVPLKLYFHTDKTEESHCQYLESLIDPLAVEAPYELVSHVLESLFPIFGEAFEQEQTKPFSLKAWSERNIIEPTSQTNLQILSEPRFVVGYQEQWISVSPPSLSLWEKLRFEPVSPKKNLSYIILSGAKAFEPEVGSFFRELTNIYELCNLGAHKKFESDTDIYHFDTPNSNLFILFSWNFSELLPKPTSLVLI